MNEPYEPELGQMMFGQPYKRFEGSNLLEAALGLINHELCRVMWNNSVVESYEEPESEYNSPFLNTGNKYKNNVFEVEAYSWSDEDQPFNLKWKDVEISWYKHYARGLSVNQDITPDKINQMLDECLEAIRAEEKRDY